MESLDFPSAHIPLFLKICELLALLQGFNMRFEQDMTWDACHIMLNTSASSKMTT